MTDLQKDILKEVDGYGAVYGLTIDVCSKTLQVEEIVREEDINATFETLYSLFRGAGFSARLTKAALYGAIVGRDAEDKTRFYLDDNPSIALTAEYITGSSVMLDEWFDTEEKLYEIVTEFLLALQYTKTTIDRYRNGVLDEIRAEELEKIEEQKRLREAEARIAEEERQREEAEREYMRLTKEIDESIKHAQEPISLDDILRRSRELNSPINWDNHRKEKAYEEVSSVMSTFGNALGGMMGMSQEDIDKALVEVDKSLKGELGLGEK